MKLKSLNTLSDTEIKVESRRLLNRLEEIRSLEPSLMCSEIQEEVDQITDWLDRAERHTMQPETGFGFEFMGPAHLYSGAVQTQQTAGTDRTYRSMFYPGQGNVNLDKGAFRDIREFLNVIDSGRYDPRLVARAAMQEGLPSTGGFSVPEEFSAQWLDASLPNEIVRRLCRVYGMESKTKLIPGWDGNDMSDGSTHGGLKMEFLAEGATATKQTAKLRQVQLTAETGAIYVDASLELIQDGKDFAAQLESAMTASLGFGIDRYCIRGTGAGQPLGVVNSPCKIQVSKESGQASDTICYSNLKRMFARQLNPERAVWLFNPSSIPELMEITVAIGTGGAHVRLLNENSGRFTIFGRPVYFTPHVNALGDEDDCLFVDFNFYALGLRKDLVLDQTDAHRWAQRERSYRILIRFDGQCTLDSAITPERGDTLSPVVGIEERA